MSMANILNRGLGTPGRKYRALGGLRALSIPSSRSAMAGQFALSCAAAVAAALLASPAQAQSFRVQCPTSTITHPTAANNNSEPSYVGPTTYKANTSGYLSLVVAQACTGWCR
jgi:hypothetical protein